MKKLFSRHGPFPLPSTITIIVAMLGGQYFSDRLTWVDVLIAIPVVIMMQLALYGIEKLFKRIWPYLRKIFEL